MMMMLIMTMLTTTLLGICQASTFTFTDVNGAVFLRGNSSVSKIKRNDNNRHFVCKRPNKENVLFLRGV